jgi:hypothetical protein
MACARRRDATSLILAGGDRRSTSHANFVPPSMAVDAEGAADGGGAADAALATGAADADGLGAGFDVSAGGVGFEQPRTRIATPSHPAYMRMRTTGITAAVTA